MFSRDDIVLLFYGMLTVCSPGKIYSVSGLVDLPQALRASR